MPTSGPRSAYDGQAMSVTPIDPPDASAPEPAVAGDGVWRRARSADGTDIAWRRDAPAAPRSGRLPVVLCNGIACSTDHWAGLVGLLAADRPVVQWDYRAHGRSAAPADPADVTVERTLADLDTVLAAAGVRRAVVVGHSFGVQVALEAARRRPDVVAGVAAVAGAAGTPLPRSATRPGVGALELAARAHERLPSHAEEVWRAWWTSPVIHLLARAVGGTSAAAPRDVMASYYEHVSSRDISVLLAMLGAMADHDASDVLPTLRVPLLAAAGDADRLTPLPVMSRMALAAPDGELAVCHGGTHTLPAEHPRWLATQLAGLLRRADARPPHRRTRDRS
jgi:pimeloyl-ACP methyl ester carboxylesterase